MRIRFAPKALPHSFERPENPVPMDPFLGDEALRQAVVRLNNGDHKPLVDLLQQAPPYSVVLLSLMSDSVSFDLDALDHWAFQDPSPAAYVVRSVARIGQAWHARGRRMAKNVDQESWSTFFAQLQKAEDDLARAYELDSSDHRVASVSLVTGRGLQLGRHEIEARFEAAQAAAPFNPVAVSEYLQNLCPKWGGSVEELLAFGRACQQAPPSHVYAYGMLPMAWLEVAVDRDPQLKVVDGYLARPKIAAELEAGAVQLLHAMGCDPSRPVDPAHPVPREALFPLNCFYLTLTKDIKYKGAGRQLAQRCRELIRGMPTELPWRYFAGGAESAGLAKVDATFFA